MGTRFGNFFKVECYLKGVEGVYRVLTSVVDCFSLPHAARAIVQGVQRVNRNQCHLVYHRTTKRTSVTCDTGHVHAIVHFHMYMKTLRQRFQKSQNATRKRIKRFAYIHVCAIRS